MHAHHSALVVEDDQDNRELLVEYLSYRGFLVAAATTGEEALALAPLFRPHAVFMDVHLGFGIDGVETTRRLRMTPAGATVIIVAVSAALTPCVLQAASEAGCDDVFAKPVHLDRLTDRVLQLLRERLTA